jgi:hypothetical protein
MQAQPTHRAVHAVHIDDHIIGIAFCDHPPAAVTLVGLVEGRFQGDLGGLIHPCQAQFERHVFSPFP